jgi:hypothetical protein
VAKRKDALTGKLGGDASPLGWRDQVGKLEPEPESTSSERTGKLKRKTYLVTQELEDRLRDLAEREQIGQNELVRYLLDHALKQVETGVHQLPAQPIQRRTLGV